MAGHIVSIFLDIANGVNYQQQTAVQFYPLLINTQPN